jgi:hypothetical protein
MRRLLVFLLLVGAALALLFSSLPARSRSLTVADTLPPGVRGAMHIHTRRSDGSGTADQVAAAANRAGLKFIVLTDHDNAASEPTKPYYRSGVLVIEGLEIGTDDGHIVALDVPKAPYPLGGEARDVLEDIARMGGFSIAAHPGSAKSELRWRDWADPVDGVEWLNADSEWRDEGMASFLRAPLMYPFRPAETLATLFDRPEPILQKWDELTAHRRVVGVAAADAHARIGLRSGEPDDPLLGVHLPSYEALFRSSSIVVSPVRLSGDAAADARAVVDAIRSGHVYSSIDALASPPAVAFTAAAGRHQFAAGDIVPDAPREVELQIDSNAPDDARIVLLKDGREETSATGPQLRHVVSGERAVYRSEIHLPGGPGAPPVPWVVTNPIYVGLVAQPRPRPARPPTQVAAQYENGPAPDWTVESSVRSKAVFDVTPGPGGTQLSMRYGLGGTLSESPYAALVMPAGPALRNHDRVTFTARADHPLRLSVQLRVPTSADGERWHRSVYLDERGRDVTVFFDDMRPRGATSQPRPDLAMVHAVLFVVDTVNARPGTSGQIWIDDVKYGRE